MAKTAKKPQAISPWWLSEATEVCSTCKQAYAFHTEIRCVDCDGEMCPSCAQITITFEFSCPGCFEESLTAAN